MSSQEKTKEDALLEFMGHTRIIRSRELEGFGHSRWALRRLVEKGLVVRNGRGIYSLADYSTEGQALIEACKLVPHGVICLLSALRFHELGTQSPHEVWMAIDPKARLPRPDGPQLRIVRYSGPALTEGVETHRIDEMEIRVYSKAKTIADCFKYRNKIGLDVALEALRDYRRDPRNSMDELWHFAKICRVPNTLRPYLEAMS
ncbi:hypothetical protein D3C86_923300 [compost metagenome]